MNQQQPNHQDCNDDDDDDTSELEIEILCCLGPDDCIRSAFEDEEEPKTLHPATLQSSSSFKTAQPPRQLPSATVEDTHTPVQLNSTPSLLSPSSSSLHQDPSRQSTPAPNHDEEHPDICYEAQRSASTAERDDCFGTIPVNQPSPSRSFQSSQHDGSQHGSMNEKNMRDYNIITIQSPQSMSSQHDSGGSHRGYGSLNEKGPLIEHTLTSREDRDQTQEPRRKRKKCANVAVLCISLGILCAGLTALLFSSDIMIQKSIKRNSPPIDSDGDGISDELEMKLGTDPFNPDTDGNGLNDNEELMRVEERKKSDLRTRAPTTSSPSPQDKASETDLHSKSIKGDTSQKSKTSKSKSGKKEQTQQPSNEQSVSPSTTPSSPPSLNPSVSSAPSSQPSSVPSTSSQPSSEPSLNPSVSGAPSSQPSLNPSVSSAPSSQPSSVPSTSSQPSSEPSSLPSSIPSFEPSSVPSASSQPSSEPSLNPSVSGAPSSQPSLNPSLSSQPSYEGFGRDPFSLLVGQNIVTPDDKFLLIFQNDGNLVLYNTEIPSVLWESLTSGLESDDFSRFTVDGNLEVVENPSTVVYTSGLSNDGLVLYLPGFTSECECTNYMCIKTQDASGVITDFYAVQSGQAFETVAVCP